MKISILGTGYAGLVTGATFAKKGFSVICADKDRHKIEVLIKGLIPFYEPGLKELIGKVRMNGLLEYSTNVIEVVKASDISFICVGTPSLKTGAINLKYVKECAKEIGFALKRKGGYHVVVVKSSVIPLTTENVILPLLEKYSGKKAGKDFGLCMNPEFLKEGSAVEDALQPDRIVIGEYDEKSGNTLMRLYKNFRCPKLRTNLRTAEMIKYASNAFLATKITFANEFANICEKFNVDVYEVMKGVGLDKRISPYFLNAGAGFGGSCFPKDLKAIFSAARAKNYDPKLLSSVLDINEAQPLRVTELAERALGNLKNKKILLLGLAFKPETDDVRETRALPIAKELLRKGAKIVAYDPMAMENFKKLIRNKNIVYAKSARAALRNVDACIIQTAWDEFKSLSANDFKAMRKPVIIDGRRTFDSPEKLIKKGITYLGIGWRNL
ncbi:MAG: UDP-glucose/GDP-mannose dehydrogenase family protein [Candidatus Thermoplasmatota archaeon]|nr:UDP-glucose/GDP-mannose dehydrogenase family protein [Candidatus Thermoplasmatota archaeon]